MTSKLKGKIAAVVVFAAFAVLYFSTLYDGIYPGASAHSVATALGLESGVTQTEVQQIDVQDAGINDLDFRRTTQKAARKVVSGEFKTRHMVWRAIVAIIARNIPVKTLAFRLNAFSAILGALTVTLAFALCRGLIIFINFHDSPVSAGGRKNSAMASAIVAATALGLSAPLWLASTRASPAAFDAFLIVVMGWLAFSVVISQNPRDLLIFGLLWGVSVFETDTGIFMGILLLAAIIRAMLVGAMMTVRSWCNLLVGIIVGLVAYMAASAFLFGASADSVLQPVKDLISSINIGVSLARGGIFGNQGLLVSVFFVVLPFGAACALAMWRDAERNAAAAGFLVFLLTCTTAISLTKSPISPWGIYSREQSSFLPVAVMILAAATAGYLSSFGAILAKGNLLPPPRPRREVRRNKKSDEFDETSVGRIIFWFTLALAVGCGLFNWREIRDCRDKIIETAAREFTARMGERTWITSTTPALDTMLRIRAWEEGRTLHVIPHGKNEAEIRRLESAVSRDEAFRSEAFHSLENKAALRDSLVSTNLDAFVVAWVSIDPKAGSHLILDNPGMWADAGRTPVPAAIGYRALDNGEKPDWNAIADDHIALWKAIIAADSVLGPSAPTRLRMDRGGVREYLCNIGDNLAEQLIKTMEAGQNKEMLARRAREIRDFVEDLRTEHKPAEREGAFY